MLELQSERPDVHSSYYVSRALRLLLHQWLNYRHTNTFYCLFLTLLFVIKLTLVTSGFWYQQRD